VNRFNRVALFVVAFALAGVAHASASTIGPDCGTCQGSYYTLTNLGLAPTDLNASDGTFDTWRVALTIDTSAYNGGGSGIDEVAIKIASIVDQASLVSAPTAGWHLMAGGINGSGCSGSGSGFECSWDAAGNGAAVGSLLTWVFDIDIASPLLSGFDEASIKARYVDPNGNKVGALVSENITLTSVPEPASLSLLAFGAVGVAALRRRGRS
jgi:PEP-CTERM motif-containing protein